MADTDGGVTFRQRKGGEIPDDFSEAALMAGALRRSGFMAEAARRFWLGRKAGLLGSELLLVLLAMWSSGRLGQRAVCAVRSVYGRALAAAFGLLCWPSQAALSRALRSTMLGKVRPFVAWLLMEALPAGALERDGSAYHHDTRGQRWRVVDGDGRVLAFRQRALPVADALPEGKRQVDDLAAPGYPGRKRGEVQVHRMVVQDAGTGWYLGVRMAPGNGEHHEELIWTAQMTAEHSRALGHPLEFTLLRLDGKASGAPSVAAALRAGIAVVTRWTDHRLLETPEIRKTLRESCWTVVPDSGSGPRRTATELGTIRLEAMPRPEAEEPTGCRPVEVRIVVTRYRVSREEARGCGVTIDGWQYELFATTVRADDWPAAELVELYYGRAGQENRFLQIDAELGKLRLITTHLPGMELLVAAGLFLSNWRLQQGAAAARWCPGPEVSQPPRKVETVPPDPTILPVGFEAPSLEQTVAGSAKHDVAPAASRWSPPTHAAPGPHQASAPSLVPAHLRRCASEILGGCRVTVELPSTRRPLPRRQPWSALTAAERQHRRHTYGERIDARHRPVARIGVAYPAGEKPTDIRRIIGTESRPQPCAAKRGRPLPALAARLRLEQRGLLSDLSLAVMWWLARAKRRTARDLGSRALEADSFQTTACFWLSLITLAGIGLNATLGWWWADPVAALGITWFLVNEGRAAWAGEDCGCSNACRDK